MTAKIVSTLRNSACLIVSRIRRSLQFGVVALPVLVAASAPAGAQTQLPVQKLASASSGVTAQEHVDGANGSFQQSIPIEVPAFFGIEPKLALSYDSKGGNGPLGMGWRVGGRR
jgi:hypothetical protein